MISEDLKIADLIRKHLTGSLLPAEREELLKWIGANPRNGELFEALLARKGFARAAAEHTRFARYMDPEAAKQERENRAPAQRRMVAWYAAAAVVVGALLTLLAGQWRAPQPAATPLRHTYASALLIRGDQEPIPICDTTTRLPEGLHIAPGTEPRDRTLSYREAQQSVPNRLIVPRGSDFKVQLSDGTEVWLNAGSELEYPEVFTGKKREVKLRGMAYFKVEKDATRPFVVHTDRTDIRVLGTEFCVSDCCDSSNRVTLVSGRVTVTDRAGTEYRLLPGQQSEVSAAGSVVREVETFYHTAWKDGYFIFHEAPLRRIMEELSAWYDLDYLIEDPSLDEVRITARLRKFDTADPLLELLAETKKIRFMRQERLIRLLPPA